MILKALMELAEREGLTGDLDYQPMPVRWAVTIDADGQLVGRDHRHATATGRRERAADHGGVSESRTDLQRTAQDACEFVVEKPEYVFGRFDESWVKEKTERLGSRKSRSANAGAPSRIALSRRVRLAAESTGDDGLKRWLAFWNNRRPPCLPTSARGI